MNVGKGHWIFALIFFLVFIVGMIWAYRKDKPVNKTHYKRAYMLIFVVVLILFLVYTFVKLKTS